MTEFVIRLAEIPIKITARYETTKNFCRAFLCDDEGLFSVFTDEEDLIKEKGFMRSEEVSEPYLEIYALYRKICEKLLDYDILFFHASAVKTDGKAYLFTADSGVGKTTHTKLWLDCYGERVEMINGDKPLLKIAEDRITVYSSPWMGKEKSGNNISAELKAICTLERAEKNYIEKSSAEKEFSCLVRQIILPGDEDKLKKAMELFNKVLEKSDFYHLKCNIEPTAAITAYEGMQDGRTVRGRSMLPFIVQGSDRVIIGKPENIKKYDVILYKRKNGKTVLHRVYKTDGENFYCVGDRENYGEWVSVENVLGVLERLIKGEKKIERGDKEFLRYARQAYYSFPLRKIYLNIKRKSR